MGRIEILNRQWELEFEQLQLNEDDSGPHHASNMNDEIAWKRQNVQYRK